MHNLMRVLHYTWPYRCRFAASVVCGLFVAILWAANLSTVYPVVSVLYTGNNLQQWIQQRIDQAEERLQSLDREKTSITELLDRTTDPVTLEAYEARWHIIRHDEKQTANHLQTDKRWQWYIDRFIPKDRFRTLVAVLIILVFLLVLRSIGYVVQETLVGSVSNRALFDLRSHLFRRALRQGPGAFDEQGTSEVMARFTNDMQSLDTGLDLIMGKLVREPFRILACLALACFFSWRLTLLALLVVPVAVLIMGRLAGRLRRQARLSLECVSAFYKILQETFQSLKIVKAFNLERYQRHRFFRAGKTYYRKVMRTVKLDALVSPLNELLGMLVVSSTLLIGTYLFLTGKTHLWGLRLASEPFEAAAIIQLYAALAGLADPCRKLSNLYGRVQRTIAAADRIFQHLDREADIKDVALPYILGRCRKAIEFDRITFTYPRGGHPALRELSLVIPAGETVALVGPNGCGKSTIVNLLARFYNPDAGTLRIDGIDVREASLRSLRQQLGLVTQETALFDDTIFNNIAHGNRQAPAEHVIEAARQAFAHDFITTLPLGYETRIGEQGGRLSGGQRQRIALARAFLRDPSILILDEATSAVDVESEVLIQRALEKFRRGRTTVIISHRLSVLSLVDRIIMLDRGMIVAQGSDAELIQTSPLYRRMRDLYFQESGGSAPQRFSA
jgi:ATP-binding cassette, subfamily B, bacterial MsbA